MLVIGKRGRRIPRAEAMSHVFGYTIANEGTVREWTRHGKFNVTQGKNFDRSGSIGPWIVTADAMPAGPLRVKTRVNGEERQNDTTDRLLFPFDFLISYLSTFTTLEPGDMILTGTPNGAGARFDPPKWLVPGDRGGGGGVGHRRAVESGGGRASLNPTGSGEHLASGSSEQFAVHFRDCANCATVDTTRPSSPLKPW